MKTITIHINAAIISDILDGRNPNGEMFADADSCIENGAEVSQEMILIKRGDFRKLFYKLDIEDILNHEN